MLGPGATNHILRLRGADPLLDLVADVLADLMATNNAEIVGQLTAIADPDKMNVGVEPRNRPGIDFGLPVPLKVSNPHCFFPPGAEGPNGGYGGILNGTVCVVPNRLEDVTIDTRDGTVLAKRIILDGDEVYVFPPPPELGDCTLKSINGDLQWECEGIVETLCCPSGSAETLTISWTDSTGGLVEGSGGSITLTWSPTGGEGDGGYEFSGVVPGSTELGSQSVAGVCTIDDPEAETNYLTISTDEPYGTTSAVYPCAGPILAIINQGAEEGELQFVGITALDAILTE